MNNKPKVYLPQIPKRFDNDRVQMVTAFDFSSAAVHGELIPIISESYDPAFMEQATEEIKKGLADYKADDFFLAVGSPIAIAVCSGVILRRFGSMKMLKWERRLSTYRIVEIKL